MADMKLPKPIADFFEMKNVHDDEGLWTLFASDAVIIDGGENTEIHGADDIKKWIKKSIYGLKLHTEIKNCKEQGGEMDRRHCHDRRLQGQPGTVRVFHYSEWR